MYDHTSYLAEVSEADYGHVEHMLDHLDEYCRYGAPLGDFLRAVVLGDLDGAVAHADGTNKKYLGLYMKYCYNQLPAGLVRLVKPVVRAIEKVQAEHGAVTSEMIAEATKLFELSLRDQHRRISEASKVEGP